MPKMKYRELKKSDATIAILSDGILWEFDFSIKLNDELASAKDLLEKLREQYIKIIKGNGGEEIQTPRGNQWGLKPPQPTSLDEKATKEEVEKTDKEYEEAYSVYENNNSIIEKEYEKLMDKEVNVVVNKIPVGEFKSNFTNYLIPELKGKKFSLSASDIDNIKWLMNFSKKKK